MSRIYSPDVYVADTLTGKGRGVFAGRDYRVGEVVEVAPVWHDNNWFAREGIKPTGD